VIQSDQGPIFCIRDNGDGVPAPHQHKIFEPSVRLHSLRDYPGVGMGLTICSRIIEAHDGKIWVESSGVKGEGSIFKFILGAL
jgi:signal transduction histidine kinase